MRDDKSYKLLKLLYKTEGLTDAQIRQILKDSDNKKTGPIVQNLKGLGLATNWENNEQGSVPGTNKVLGCKITMAGMAYIEKRRRDFWAFLLPYSITTAIAVLSLVMSILTYLHGSS